MKLSKSTVCWTIVKHEDWHIHIAASSTGLCYVGSANKPYAELEEWVLKRRPGSSLVRDDERMRPFALELAEYLEGRLSSFTVPSDLQGTPFQTAVWEALRQIPYGETWSYSDVARHIGKPASVRAVGAAVGANPLLITVPCHRVIGKSGALTGYRGGLEMKTRLLSLEQGNAGFQEATFRGETVLQVKEAESGHASLQVVRK
nr:methylated-DNA--[protein]-cysteine S-methyltransferase [Paenibacillus caui]